MDFNLVENDEQMDKELRAFFNKFILKSSIDDIAVKFKLLTQAQQFAIVEKYLMYFFTYSISSSVTQFKYDHNEDIEYKYDHKCMNRQIFYREMSYSIDVGKTDWSYNSFNVKTRYEMKHGEEELLGIYISVTYDLFECGSVGFNFDNSADTPIRDQVVDLIKRVYEQFMSIDEVHVWLMFHGLENSVKELLLLGDN